MADSRCKYYKQKKQVSYDNGVTWYDVIPYEYQKGELYEMESKDCGYVPPVTEYRWVKTNDTVCIGEPEPVFDGKLRATYSDSASYELACVGNSTLSKEETRPSSYTYSAMTTAEIGTCVTTIGEWAFAHRTKLTDPPNPNSLTSVTIADSVTTISNYAFRGCPSLTSITIPNSVTSIGNNAFEYCSGLTSINIPSGVTSISKFAFCDCRSLTSVNIPNSVTTIGDYAFGYCPSLTSIIIPNSVTSISSEAFYRCNGLASIVIPNSVTSIGSWTFQYCTSLTSVTIGNSVTNIGRETFGGCTSLISVTCLATTPPTAEYGIFNDTNNCPIYVPAASVDAYKAATNWSSYASRIQAIP